MLDRDHLTPPEALACTMVLVAAADGGITDREIGVMAAQVQSLPAFQGFSLAHLTEATEAAIALLEEPEGLTHGGRLIRAALSPALRETAYVLAAEIVAAEPTTGAETMRMLAFLAAELGIDPHIADALARGARARQALP